MIFNINPPNRTVETVFQIEKKSNLRHSFKKVDFYISTHDF